MTTTTSKTMTSADLRAAARDFMKPRIPRSWFTKRGPGVEAAAKIAFQRMGEVERRVCVRLGWFPESWMRLPYAASSRGYRRVPKIMGRPPALPMPGPVPIGDVETFGPKKPKPNPFRRALSAIGRLFGSRRGS